MGGLLAAAGTPLVVYVGSGGCDVGDSCCIPDEAAQRAVRAVALGADGTAEAAPSLGLDDVGGTAAWIVGSRRHSRLFVARPSLDDVLSVAVGADGKLLAGGEACGTGGRNPVDADLTADGAFLVVANYNGPDDTKVCDGASVAALRVGAGGLLSLASRVEHTGSGPDPARQGAAHPHGVVVARSGLVYACDLGVDTVFVYSLDGDGKLAERHRAPAPPGSGPRHCAEHPTLPLLYVVTEMGQEVLVYHIRADGALELRRALPLVPEGGEKEGSKAAELVVLPCGSALYATNRGRINTVTAFGLDAGGVNPTWTETHPAPAFPRGMALVGGVLLVAGQSRTEVWSYTAGDGGRLTRTPLALTAGLPANPAAFGALR